MTLAAAPAAGPDGPSAASTPRRILAVAAVLGAMAMVVLDANAANVALPAIAAHLQVSAADAVLVVTCYQAALVMALLPLGALGERLGYRPVFAAGLVGFIIASIGCATASTLPELLTARFLQGLGGAAIMALGVPLLRFAAPEGAFGRAIGWNALTVALAAASGPVIGSAVLVVAPWPWIFLLSVPVGAAALAASAALPAAGGAGRPWDLVSVALNGAMFGALILALELGRSSAGAATAAAACAVIAGVALHRREAAKAAPLFPFDLLRLAPFRRSATASVLCFAGQTAALIALPFLIHAGGGMTPLVAGCLLAAWPLSVAATAPVAGRLADRTANSVLCAWGASILACGLVVTAAFPPAHSVTGAMAGVILCGMGFGLFQTANNRTLFMAAPIARSAAAGGLQGSARLTGQTAGALAITFAFSAMPLEAAARAGLAIGAVLALAAAVVSGAGSLESAPAR